MRENKHFSTGKDRRLIFFAVENAPPTQSVDAADAEATKERENIKRELSKLKDSLSTPEDMHFRKDGLLDGFSIKSVRIDCSRAPVRGRTIANTLDALQHVTSIIERQNIRISGPLVMTHDGNCLEFESGEGSAKKRYLATQHELLVIVEDRKDLTTAEERSKLPQLKKDIYELGIRTGQWRNEPSEAERKRSAEEEKKLKKGEWEKLMSDLVRLEQEESTIDMRSHARILRNESTDTSVRELSSNPNSSQFLLERDLPEGRIRHDNYDWDGLKKREYLRDNSVESSEEFRKDKLIARHTYKDGKLQKTDHIQSLQATERVTHITEHLPVENVLFPVLIKGERVFVAPFSDRKLTPDESTAIISSLDTKESFDFFEEIYWKELAPLYSKNDAFRDAVFKRGRELYGVDVAIEQLEQFLKERGVPFKIRLESLSNGSRVKLREAARVLPELLKAVGSYPPQYLRNGTLRALYILGDLKGVNVERAAGYYSSQDGLIVITPVVSSDQSAWAIFHHEYLHYDDDIEGKLNSHQDWLSRFHGNGKHSDGEEVYGKFIRTVGNFSMGVDDTGFARSYGRLNPNEDLATLAEGLMSPGTSLDVRKRAENDPILHEKIIAMKRRFFVRSLGRIDEKFWEDLEHHVPIDSDYWKKREARGDFKTDEIAKLEQYQKAREEQQPRLTTQSLWKELANRPDDSQKELIIQKWREIAKVALEKDPYNTIAWTILQQSYNWTESAAKPKLLQEQIQITEQHLRVLPEQDHEPSDYDHLAELYEKFGENEKARQCYERGIRLFPRDFTLRERLCVQMAKSMGSTPAPKELVQQREAIYRQSGQREHFIALRDSYAQAGMEQELSSLTQTYLRTHISDASARTVFEKSMIKQKREQEVITFYENIDRENPSVQGELAIAVFAAYHISGAEGEKRFKQVMEKHREPAVIEAYFTFLRDWIRAKGKEKGQTYFREKAVELHQLIDQTEDMGLATQFLSLMSEYGSTEDQRRELLFVRQKFQNRFVQSASELNGGLDSAEHTRLKQYTKAYRHVIQALSTLEKTKGTPDSFTRVNQEYLNELGVQVDFGEFEDASAFFALLLHFEKHDLTKAIELCTKHMEDRTWTSDRKKDTLKTELGHLRAMQKPMTWVQVNEAEYAWPKTENVLYRRTSNRITKLERWVAKADNFDSFEWGGMNRETTCTETELPEALRRK